MRGFTKKIADEYLDGRGGAGGGYTKLSLGIGGGVSGSGVKKKK